jgi:hypothetical protein
MLKRLRFQRQMMWKINSIVTKTGSVALIRSKVKETTFEVKLKRHVQTPSLSKSSHLTSRLFQVKI